MRDAASKGKINPCFIAVSSFLLWTLISFRGEGIREIYEYLGYTLYFWSTVANIISFLLFAVFYKRLAAFFSRPAAAMAAAFACSCGMLLLLLDPGALGAWITVVAALATGVGTASFYMVFALRLNGISSDGLARGMLFVFAATAIGRTVCYFLPPVFVQILAVVLPSASGLLLFGPLPVAEKDEGKTVPREDAARYKGLLVRALLAIMVFVSATMILDAPSFAGEASADASSLLYLGLLIALCVLLVIAVTFFTSRCVDFASLYRSFFFIGISSFAFCILIHNVPLVVSATSAFSGLLLRCIVLGSLVVIHRQAQLPLLLVFAVGEGFLKVVGFIPKILALSMVPQVSLGLSEAASVGILCYAFAYVFILREGDVHALTSVERALTPAEMQERVYQRLADSYQLSSREREVVELAAQGRTSRHIASELFLSVNTVNMYLGKAYRKIGIHGRQELLDLVEEMRRNA